MNCGTCLGYLREKNKCCGCWPESGYKPAYCVTCIIKNCDLLGKTSSKFCYECEKFPCQRLKRLDKRYRTKYRVSFIQNLLSIKEIGISDYLVREETRWICPGCSAVICVHRDNCLSCKQDLKNHLQLR
jgi:hypothetical protein